MRKYQPIFNKSWLRSILFLAILYVPANAAEVLVNGGFESGDFSGWTTTINTTSDCQTDWNVSNVGGSTATGCQPDISGTLPGAPAEGTFAAYNSFDGEGPIQYRLTQSLVVPASVSSATLSWAETYNLDLTFGATVVRQFTVEVTDATDTTVYGVIESQDIGDTTALVEIDWTTFSNDITAILQAHVNETVNIAFTNIIPENFTGPGGFGLDNVSLDVISAPASIPTLSEWSLIFLVLLLGVVGFRFTKRQY